MPEFRFNLTYKNIYKIVHIILIHIYIMQIYNLGKHIYFINYLLYFFRGKPLFSSNFSLEKYVVYYVVYIDSSMK